MLDSKVRMSSLFIRLRRMCRQLSRSVVPLLLVALATSGSGCAERDVPLPESFANGPDVFLQTDTRTVEDVVSRRATLETLLGHHEIAGDVAYELIEIVRPVFDPRRLRVGNPYKMVLANDGNFRRFEYHIDSDEFLLVSHLPDSDVPYEAQVVPYEKDQVEAVVNGRIDERNSSLVAALDDNGENVNLAIQMAQVFSGEIDFNNDLRRGDHFDVLFEKYYREDQFAGYGDVVAAEFHNDGRTIQAFGFQVPGDDVVTYYDADGRSMKRLFLKSPFRFEPRVTSRFSYRRLHPVLGTNRPHLGVDYGAPTGTPVVSVANGRVVSAARSGGSGNMVRLRHTNGYETYYLHLSKFAKGMRPGARVAQGQTIGYVGATGLATGPHLDYRIRKNGTFVNPLLEHRNLPPGDPVPSEHLEAFFMARDSALGRMTAPRYAGRAPIVLAQ